MTGPGKRDEELRAAVDAPAIRAVTVESPGELARLEAIAAEAGPPRSRSCCGRRSARAPGSNGSASSATTAPGSSDGRRPTCVASARRAAASPHLELLGLHVFGASNVLDAAALVDHVAATVRAARQLAPSRARRSASSMPAAVSASRTRPHEESLDLAASAVASPRSWPPGRAIRSSRDARLLLEPGRFLVGPAGAYVARVVDRKTVDGSTVVVLDGGVHHLLRPALVGQEHRIRTLSGRGRRQPRTGASDR